MVGLRNRLGILSETFSYLSFQDRIKSARRFVEEIINYASQHGPEIRKATDDADRQSIVGQAIALRGTLAKSPEKVELLYTELVSVKNPYTGRNMQTSTDVRHSVTADQYISFDPSESTTAPAAYFVPATSLLQDRLEAHGIAFTKLNQPLTIKGEQFRIESSTQATGAYEGHTQRALTGKWEPADLNVPAGTLVVTMDQPLGRLAVLLLEPRSEDSFASWGMMEDSLAAQPQFFSITRTMEKIPESK